MKGKSLVFIVVNDQGGLKMKKILFLTFVIALTTRCFTYSQKMDEYYIVSTLKEPDQFSLQFDARENEIEDLHYITINNRGLAYYNIDDFDNALADFTQAISIQPKISIAYNNRANTYIKLGMYDQAYTDIDHARELNAKNFSYYNYKAGEIAYYMGDYVLAYELLEKSIRGDSSLINSYVLMGNCIFNYNDDETVKKWAQEKYKYVLKYDSLNFPSNFNLSLSYFKAKNLDSALIYIDKTIKIDSNCFDCYNNAGVFNAYLNKFGDAKKCFSKAQILDSNNADIYNNRGTCYIELNILDSAKLDYIKALLKYKIELKYNDSLAQENYTLRKFNNASFYYELSNKLYYKQIRTLINLANLYSLMNEDNLVVLSYSRADSIYNLQRQNLENLGDIYFQIDLFEQASAKYNAIYKEENDWKNTDISFWIKVGNTNLKAYNNLVENKGSYNSEYITRASIAFTNGMKIDSTNYDVLFNIGLTKLIEYQACWEYQVLRESVDFLSRAIQQNPSCSKCYRKRAEAYSYYHTGENMTDKAKLDNEKADKIDSKEK